MRPELGPAAGLVRLSFLVQSVYADTCQANDLTVAQSQLLCVIAESPRSMAELADLLGLERSSLTGLVDRAEQRGLVVRQADPSDRRVVRVGLSATGDTSAGRFHHDLTERLQLLLSDLPATERDRFSRTMGKIVAEVPAVFADQQATHSTAGSHHRE